MLFEHRLRNTRLTEASGAGSGGGGGQKAESPYKEEQPSGERKKPAGLTVSESEAQYQVQLQRFGGNHEMLARQLWGEQLQARRRNREIREERDALKARNPQGSLVLVGEQVTDFNAYKAMGKPAELKTKLDNLVSIESQLAAVKRKEQRTAAAKALNFNAAVLSDRLDVAGLELEVREEPDATGKKQPVAYTKKAGDATAQWEKLADVAARDWTDHLPALKAVGGGQSTAAAGQGSSGSSTVIELPNNGAGGGQAGSVVDRFIANRDKANAARPNPMKAQGAAQKSA